MMGDSNVFGEDGGFKSIGPSPPLANIVLFVKVFKTHLLGRGFHTLTKNVSFSSQPMWDLTIHSPSEPSVLTDTHSLLQSMWDPPIHPLQGLASCWQPPRVHPLWGSASSMAHRLVSNSNTICNTILRCFVDILRTLLIKPPDFLNILHCVLQFGGQPGMPPPQQSGPPPHGQTPQ